MDANQERTFCTHFPPEAGGSLFEASDERAGNGSSVALLRSLPVAVEGKSHRVRALRSEQTARRIEERFGFPGKEIEQTIKQVGNFVRDIINKLRSNTNLKTFFAFQQRKKEYKRIFQRLHQQN